MWTQALVTLDGCWTANKEGTTSPKAKFAQFEATEPPACEHQSDTGTAHPALSHDFELNKPSTQVWQANLKTALVLQGVQWSFNS